MAARLKLRARLWWDPGDACGSGSHSRPLGRRSAGYPFAPRRVDPVPR